MRRYLKKIVVAAFATLLLINTASARVAYVPRGTNSAPNMSTGATLGVSSNGKSASVRSASVANTKSIKLESAARKAAAAELPSTPEAQAEYNAEYAFAYRFLVFGFCKPANYAALMESFGTEKMRFLCFKNLEAKIGEEKAFETAKQIEVEKIDAFNGYKESWLIKFPHPRFMPLPSFVLILSDGKCARYFTNERTMPEAGESPDSIGFCCESGVDKNSRFTHSNSGIRIPLYDRDIFISTVRRIVEEKLTPIAGLEEGEVIIKK